MTHESPDTPPPRRPANFSRQFALAMELPFVLAGSVLVGGFFGYWLDRWLGTRPMFLLALGALGLFAGVRELLRRFGSEEKRGRRDSA